MPVTAAQFKRELTASYTNIVKLISRKISNIRGLNSELQPATVEALLTRFSYFLTLYKRFVNTGQRPRLNNKVQGQPLLPRN